MDCEKTFADWKATRRSELTDLLTRNGLRAGDVLCLRAIGDLGRGAEAKRHQKRIHEIGATIEVVPADKDVRQRGRPARFKPTDDQKEHLCSLWYSPAPLGHVLERASEIAGREIRRDQMYYICGPRDGSRKR